MADTLMLIEVRPLKTYIEIARFQDICVANVFSFSFIGFSDAHTPLTMHLRSLMSGQSCEICQPLEEPSP